MTKRKHKPETWIGVVSLLPDGERFAVAWVRRSDEWLADTGVAERGHEIGALVQMYRDAVAKRGDEPDVLNVRAAVHAAALREALGPGVPVKAGFDRKAEALSDAATAAVDIAFDEAMDAHEHPDVVALDGAPCEYDPDKSPDPDAWLAMDEPARQLHVRAAHVLAGEDIDDQQLNLHAGMHEAVENQLAMDDPPEAAEAFMRLRREGLGRHDVVHALAFALMKEMNRVLTQERPFDRDAYAADLRALTADGWRRRGN